MSRKIIRRRGRLHYLAVNRRADRGRLIGRTPAATRRGVSTRSSLMIRQITNLRFALLADAVASGATGLMMIAGADLLTGLLGLPVALMREAGLVLVPYVALV